MLPGLNNFDCTAPRHERGAFFWSRPYRTRRLFSGVDCPVNLPAGAPATEPLARGETVTRVVRVSRARGEGPAMEKLFAARRRVHGETPFPGLGGAVLHVSGWYVLWQEGPDASIEAALRARKRRHGPERVLHRSVGPRTLTERLGLSTTQWPEGPELFEQRIEAVAAAAQRLKPQEVWRALGEPCTLQPPAQSPLPPCRVGLLASDDQRSIELARQLAERFRRPLVYRRFAGGEPGTTDVGAAYFDLPVRGQPLRVQALSRRAFGHALVHESLRLPDWLGLVVGEHATKAMELAAGVASFLRRGTHAPGIDLLADSGAVGQSVDEFLRSHVRASVQRLHAGPGDTDIVSLILGGASPAPAAA